MDVFQQNVADQINKLCPEASRCVHVVCFASAAVTHKPLKNYWSLTLTACRAYIWKICRVCSFLWSTVIMQTLCNICLCESELQCECGFSNHKTIWHLFKTLPTANHVWSNVWKRILISDLYMPSFSILHLCLEAQNVIHRVVCDV